MNSSKPKKEPLRIKQYEPILDPRQERDFDLRQLINAKNEAIRNISLIVNQRINSINKAYIETHDIQTYRINESNTRRAMDYIDFLISNGDDIAKEMRGIKQLVQYYDDLTRHYVELLQNKKKLLDPVERNTTLVTEIPEVTIKGKLPEALGTEIGSFLINKPVEQIDNKMANVYRTLTERKNNKNRQTIGGKKRRKKTKGTRKNILLNHFL